ncbi:hypothetical protein [Nocardioides sp. J9]|uniref:hypothetical protein n=1 Tax=Nocardioides sp. J9 TaxID=935844 RepID=UPI0011A85639|nr:hypothetical protein [Nocardioides sp. J9]
MDPAEVLALVAVAAVAALLLAGGPAPGASARQFADEYLLAVEETHAGLVEQAHRVDRRLLGLATLAGLVGYAAARLLVEPGVAVWVAVPALAATVGALRLWRAGQDLAPEPGSPVVARVRAVRLADYLPPVGLVVLVASPVLALGCLVAGIEAVRRDVPDVEAVWLVVGLGAAMAVLGVAAPWSAGRSRPRTPASCTCTTPGGRASCPGRCGSSSAPASCSGSRPPRCSTSTPPGCSSAGPCPSAR